MPRPGCALARLSPPLGLRRLVAFYMADAPQATTMEQPGISRTSAAECRQPYPLQSLAGPAPGHRSVRIPV